MEDTFKPQGPKLSPYSSDLKCTALSNSLCCSYCALLNLDFMNSPRKQLIQDSCLFCTEYYKLKSFKKRYPRNFWSHSVFGEWAKYKIILNFNVNFPYILDSILNKSCKCWFSSVILASRVLTFLVDNFQDCHNDLYPHVSSCVLNPLFYECWDTISWCRAADSTPLTLPGSLGLYTTHSSSLDTLRAISVAL